MKKQKQSTEVENLEEPSEVIRIEAYSLFEFCQKVQEAILAGYKFDFDSNENFPANYGSSLSAGLVKECLVKAGMVK